MPSAATRVFQVTELLEQILLSMFDKSLEHISKEATSMGSLLRCQRVSHNFKAVIEGSLVLQNRLWYSKWSYPEESLLVETTHLNPLFSEHRCMKMFPLGMSPSIQLDADVDIWIHKAAFEDGDENWRQMRLFRFDDDPWAANLYGHSDHFLRFSILKSDTTAGEFVDGMRKWMGKGRTQTLR